MGARLVRGEHCGSLGIGGEYGRVVLGAGAPGVRVSVKEAELHAAFVANHAVARATPT